MTYACRELVIAYAAWISPAFHLKVIRVFLGTINPPVSPRLVQIPAEGNRFLVVFDSHGQPRILDAERKCLVDGHDLVNLQTFLREFLPVAHLGPALDIIGQRAVRALASKCETQGDLANWGWGGIKREVTGLIGIFGFLDRKAIWPLIGRSGVLRKVI